MKCIADRHLPSCCWTFFGLKDSLTRFSSSAFIHQTSPSRLLNNTIKYFATTTNSPTYSPFKSQKTQHSQCYHPWVNFSKTFILMECHWHRWSTSNSNFWVTFEFEFLGAITVNGIRQGRTQGGCTGCTCIPPSPPVHPPHSPAWKAGYEKRQGSEQKENNNQNIFEIY
jgi:hypothetical protein